MTFPTIPTAGNGRLLTSSQATATTTHTFPNLSTLTKTAGDLILAVIVTYQATTANAEFSGWGGGLTEFIDEASNAALPAIGAAYKLNASGSESGTFTVTTATSVRSAMFLMAIPGAHTSTAPEAGTRATGTTAAGDPGALDPGGWAAEDTLWVAVGANGETSLTGAFGGITAAPTNYTSMVDVPAVGGDVVGAIEGAVAFRQLNATSEDVGVWALDLSAAANAALLIAVRPAPTPLAATLVDDFEDGTLDTAKWTVIAGSPTETGGRLVLPQGGTAVRSVNTYNWQGSSAFIDAPVMATGTADVHFIARIVGGSACKFRLLTTTLNFTVDGGSPSPASVTYNSSTMRYWRHRESGGTWFFDTSADGTNWTNQSTVATPSFVNSAVYEIWNDFGGTGNLELEGVNVAPAGAKTLADSGQGADTLSVAVAVPLADAGLGGGQLQVTAAVPLTGSGQAADTLATGQPKTLTDSGQASDSLTVATQTAVTDQGTATDQLQAAAQVPLGQSGQATDQLQVAAPVSLAEQGTAADLLAVRQPTWLTDTFGQFGTSESWADSSTHGQWLVQFGGVAAGNGVGTETDAGSTVLFEQPDTATTAGVTHAGLVTSTAQFGANLDFSADVKTTQQLRQNTPPNGWEVAWLVWAYTDNNHCYYFAFKTNGIELGKRHPAYAGGQRFLWTAATPTLTLNTWNRIRVVQDGDTLSVFIDGTELTLGTGGPNGKSFVDVGGAQADSPYLTGKVGLYNEDAHVRFDNVTVNAVPLADVGQAATQQLTVAGTVPLTDPAGGVDSLTVDQGTAVKTLADSGQASDSLSAGQGVPVTLSDRGGVGGGDLYGDSYTSGEVLTVAAAAVAADSGAATDRLQVTATVAVADQGGGVDRLSGAAQATLTDQGQATDLLQAAAQASLAEQGTAADQLQIAAAAKLAEGGQASDSLTVDQGIPKTLTDQGQAADSLTVAAAAPLADAGQGSDSLTVDQGTVPKTLADQGLGSDRLQVTVQALLADQGTATDQPQVAAQAGLVDSGTATDQAPTITAAASLAEVGTGAETFQPTGAVGLADSGAATDQALLAAQVPLGQQGTAADSLTVAQFEPKTLPDTAVGVEALQVTAAADAADAAAAADSLTVSAALLLTQQATAAEALQVPESGAKTLTDQGLAAETATATAQATLGDQATAADSRLVDVPRTLSDAGVAGSDLLLPAATIPLSDQATGSDQTLPAAAVPLPDSGAGADSLTAAGIGDQKTLADQATSNDQLLVTQAKLLTDSATGSDQLTVNVGRVLTDAGVAADTLRPTVLLVLADQATTSDAVALAALTTLGDHGAAADTMIVQTVAYWIRTDSREPAAISSSREPVPIATSSQEPVLVSVSREQGSL